jgi:hypothetical protein
MFRPSTFVRAIFVIACLALVCPAKAASPSLERITPRGGQRGTELDVYFTGHRLKDIRDILIYEPGITVAKITADNTDLVTAHLKIVPDARLGEYHMRLCGETGISELRTFWVGPFPTTQAWAGSAARLHGKAAVPNMTWDHPQPLAINTTVEGVIEDEQIHYYMVNARKGQRLSVEVEGMRLGTAMFDPVVSILNPDQSEVATCDDTPLLKQDPYLSLVPVKDGPLILEIHDSEFGGGPTCYYRMHVGNFPRPAVCFPLGGPANETLAVKFLGDPSGAIAQMVQLPSARPEPWPVFAMQQGQTSPSGNYLRVVDFPNVVKTDSDQNQDFAHAIAAVGLPVAFNGILTQPKEVDYFKFEARQGASLYVDAWARRLSSPIDTVLLIYDSKGRQLLYGDDYGGPDSFLHFRPPADGEYYVAIKDYLKGGGPSAAYRIEITESKPSCTIAIPNASQVIGPTQERQTIPIPRGGRYATMMRLDRSELPGEMKIVSANLPPGVTMTAVPTESNLTPVLFEAKRNAPLSGELCDFFSQLADPKAPPIEHNGGSDVDQEIALVVSSPNQTTYYKTPVHQFAVAVTKESPFSVDLVAPAAPLVQSGQIRLKVKATRQPDFKGVITVHGLFDLPGVASQPVQIPADQTEIDFLLSASEGAATSRCKIGVIAEADVNGPLTVASNLVDLQVSKAFFTGKLQMASVEQGGTAQIVCDLTQMTKFDGEAKVRLVGLPPNVTADAKQVTAADDKVVFTVAATNKTSIGRNTSLAVQATLQVNGQEEQQSVAQNGVLRIDPSGKADKPKQEQADVRK